MSDKDEWFRYSVRRPPFILEINQEVLHVSEDEVLAGGCREVYGRGIVAEISHASQYCSANSRSEDEQCSTVITLACGRSSGRMSRGQRHEPLLQVFRR